MKKLVMLVMLILSLSLVVVMNGTVLGAVQFVEGFNASAPVNDSANYDVGGYTYGLKYIPTVSYNLRKVELMAGIGTGPFTVQLRPDSGGWPSSTILLATTFTMVDTVSWQGAEFSSSYPVAAGTTYWIVFKPVPGSQASICMGSATPITAVYDDPRTGTGWDGYVISYFNGLPLPWMAKFYKETGAAGYSATIWGWDYIYGWQIPVPITMDGVPTGYSTPHSFPGLTGTHTFTVPSTNSAGHPFSDWSTDWTDETLTVSSDGTYTARYRAGYNVTIWAWCASESQGWISRPITMDGVPTGYSTPHSFPGLTGTHTFTVPSTDALGHTFYEWDTGLTGTTLTVNSAGVYTARYKLGTKVNTQIVFSLSPNPASPGQSVTLSGTLKTVGGIAVYPATVTVAYSTNGGATWTSAWTLSTNSAGAFSKTFAAPAVGTYLLRASYAGSATYNPSSYTQTLAVQTGGKVNSQIAFTLSPNPAKVGVTITLSGTLKDANGNPVYPAQVKVDYSTNGGATWNSAWTLSTNSAGTFSKTFTAPAAGTYLIRVSYAGSTSYNPSSSTVTLTIS